MKKKITKIGQNAANPTFFLIDPVYLQIRKQCIILLWRAQVGQEGVQEAQDRGQIRGQAAGAQQR